MLSLAISRSVLILDIRCFVYDNINRKERKERNAKNAESNYLSHLSALCVSSFEPFAVKFGTTKELHYENSQADLFIDFNIPG